MAESESATCVSCQSAEARQVTPKQCHLLSVSIVSYNEPLSIFPKPVEMLKKHEVVPKQYGPGNTAYVVKGISLLLLRYRS